MESLTSAQAAEILGVNAQKFHRLVNRHELHAVFVAEGIRGVMLWNPRDIESLRDRLAAEAVA